ncbi:hypothetical protein NPIL_167511 [Nephila pilipes]|uniref:Uncharacterized protein n=1 Tax=Nephila pilipes TaxID=299642 RepID=A0A8X6PZL3_NEPPI|nr:hypothetical protein NPIL_366681 [Nephila pilipes]GFT92284.1 hypothetical protein NPIL_167511 [Nephila pilipes]
MEIGFAATLSSVTCTAGLPPSKRDFHSASVIDNFMYIFGGRSVGDSGEDYYLNDIMCLDTNSMVWSSPFCSGRVPNGRRSHSAGELNFLCLFK